MQLITSGYDLFIARNIYHQFSRKPGSHRIASAFSLCHLSRLIRLRKPRTVLEIGAGIGTISQLVLLHQERVESLYSIEQIHSVAPRSRKTSPLCRDKAGGCCRRRTPFHATWSSTSSSSTVTSTGDRPRGS